MIVENNGKIKILEWDSRFFGFNVAEIEGEISSLDELYDQLAMARKKNIKLLYWRMPSQNQLVENQVVDSGGLLVDVKCTYETGFPVPGKDGAPGINGTIKNVVVTSFEQEMGLNNLEELAVASGRYSRFSRDSKIPTEKFEEMYRIWIRESINKNIADDVLVLCIDGQVAGMVTVLEKHGIGYIGLLSVDDRYRGKGYGSELVRQASSWFVEHGYQRGRVVTQKENQAACNLYEKCGYYLLSAERFFHFWLE